MFIFREICYTEENLSVAAAAAPLPGLRHPASAALRLRLAGRGPNSDSLFPPLAAVVAVAPTEGRPWHFVKLRLFARGSPTRGNGDDRRQRRKQGVAVGAAASRMQAAAQQTLGAATRVRSTSGVTVRPTLDEQSFFILKTAVPCYRGQQLRNNILVKLLLISVAGHYFLRYIRLPVSSRK